MSKDWHYILWGKHPCSTEYISLGKKLYENEPLIDWARAGYQQLVHSDYHVKDSMLSFWLMPGAANRLICGVVGIGRDHVDRRYPLIIAAQGQLEIDEKNWEALNTACREPWNALHEVAQGKYISNVEELSQAVTELPPPESVSDDWDSFQSVEHSAESWRLELERSINSEQVVIKLDQPGESVVRQAIVWQRRCRQLMTIHPYAVFIDEQHERMVMLYRPLRVTDFKVLFG